MTKKLSPEYIAFLQKQPQGYCYQSSTNNSSKQSSLDILNAKFTNCMKCPLSKQGRSQVVFGTGNTNAELMFIGEAPERDEDKHGKPFVGRAGVLLTKIIEAMGLNRDDVYISNVVKCRPPENRTPVAKESNTCMNLILSNEIKIVSPRIICTLGSVATAALLGPDTKISQVRGRLHTINGYTILPTYHPAYLLTNPSAKRFVWDDMQHIISFLKLTPQQG